MPLGTALPEFAADLLARVGRWTRAHHRGLALSTLLGLAGFGVTAFGIAPLAPDAAQLPQRLLLEPIVPPSLDGQLEALAGLRLQLTRGDVTRASDTADSLLRRLGVEDAAAAQWMRSDALARRLIEGRPGKLVQAQVDAQGRLLSLVARFPVDEADSPVPQFFHRFEITRQGEHFSSRAEQRPLERLPRLASGRIDSSLFAATDEANIPDGVAVQLAEVFSTDIDFRRELRKGDRFSLIYESLSADGEPVPWGNGRLLAAEFVNNGKTYQAAWFGEGRGGYYDLKGQSKRRAFLSSPLAFSRVTSGFAMRFHPIHKTWRAHLGTDYGAPTGTPVRSVGDGSVVFSGWQNGYGNVVRIQHSGGRETVYAHLSRIDVRKGQRVGQGDRLGAVGATGWATGPHLHFEFLVGGQHQDPQVIAKASEVIELDPAQRGRFASLAQTVSSQLALATRIDGHPGQFE
ncbi:M23 family metallopeptidase [Ideonella sp. 4Y16]|uniref:M23 family metallopeptidase n=1 Tax=Ideonella alba TaxID=2824118 RepID=A0A940YBY4_9BURK|nr:M23 family metallopeptidase [Ideonella alba]MBQ0932346.1 M23 family metallopeptidase [Ideonella alba]MBQ0944496.1 M23 family metallopeptidase [Ideonella alba]